MSTLQSLLTKTKPELVVMAKELGLRNLQNAKKEVIASRILETSCAPVVAPVAAPVAAPMAAPMAAPVVAKTEASPSFLRALTATKASSRVVAAPPAPVVPPSPPSSVVSSVDSQSKRVFVVNRSLSFDHNKLQFLFGFLKPSYCTTEWILLRMLWSITPESFSLNAGHTTPYGDTQPHYTLSIAHTVSAGYKYFNHYHLRYERNEKGKEIYLNITNKQRDIIADFQQRTD